MDQLELGRMRSKTLWVTLTIALALTTLTLSQPASALEPVVPELPFGRHASVAFGLDSNPVIAYFAQEVDDNDIWTTKLAVATCGNADCTSVASVHQLAIPADAYGVDTAIAIDSAGNPVVLYSSAVEQYFSSSPTISNARVDVVRCATPDCSAIASNELIVDEDDPLLFFDIGNGPGPFPGTYEDLELVLDANGFPFIGFTAGRFSVGERAATMTCDDAACSATSNRQTYTSIGSIFLEPSGKAMLLGSEFITCADAQCSDKTTVPMAGPIWTAMSANLGNNGLPVIVFSRYSPKGSTVEVRTCVDAMCSEHTTHVIDRAEASQFEFATGPSGNLVIAYQLVSNDSSAGPIRIAQCGTADCSADNAFTTTSADKRLDVGALVLAPDGDPLVVGNTSFTSTPRVVVIDCDAIVCAANTPVCLGFPVSIDLNDPDSAAPSNRGDVILGTDGPDTINAKGGNDVVCGGLGDDIIVGGLGNDLVSGDEGDDSIEGNAGNDRLIGRAGADQLSGGAGEDVLHGNNGDDSLDGGDGDDRIFGYAGNDTIRGGNGDDRLHGNFGEDSISGQAGNDRIFGYGDNDVLEGGDGNDLIGGNRGNDILRGGDGNDVLYGSDGQDELHGELGDDDLQGNSMSDLLFGNEGNDTLDGGIFPDACDGGAGFDTATRCETISFVP